jgi:hypothetical protein
VLAQQYLLASMSLNIYSADSRKESVIKAHSKMLVAMLTHNLLKIENEDIFIETC